MRYLFLLFFFALLSGCSAPPLPGVSLRAVAFDDKGQYEYRLGVSDVVTVFVWRNPDVSGDYIVRPDGKLNMSLTSPLQAEGLTTGELEKSIEASLSEIIKRPNVSVIIKQANGSPHEMVRVVGSGTKPFSLPYKKGMTLLDLMTTIGGLHHHASGNRAELVRTVHGVERRYSIRLSDLLKKADLSANVELQPGDVIRIPQSIF